MECQYASVSMLSTMTANAFFASAMVLVNSNNEGLSVAVKLGDH
jgi:hypothetical protein